MNFLKIKAYRWEKGVGYEKFDNVVINLNKVIDIYIHQDGFCTINFDTKGEYYYVTKYTDIKEKIEAKNE